MSYPTLHVSPLLRIFSHKFLDVFSFHTVPFFFFIISPLIWAPFLIFLHIHASFAWYRCNSNGAYSCACTFVCVSPGANIATGEEVAIKLECVKTKHPQLHIESKFYKMMQGGGKERILPRQAFIKHSLSNFVCLWQYYRSVHHTKPAGKM